MRRKVRWLLPLAGLALVVSCATQGGAPGRPGAARPDKLPRVGVILPLSGRYALFGRSSLNGIECAAALREPCGNKPLVELVTRDTAGEPARAAQAVRELVEQEKVVAIIGPLLSRTVVAVATEAEKMHVPLISLSQRNGIAELGDHIYRIGLNPQSQILTIARYATREKGYRQFAIMHPDNRYGRVYRDLFRAAVEEQGGSVATVRPYSAKLERTIDMRKEHGAENARTQSRATLSPSGEVVEVNSDTLESIPTMPKLRGVEAVFIPDSYRALLALLQAYGRDVFGNAALLGVNRWNNQGILNGGVAVDGATFVDGFFPNSSTVDTQRFVDMFTRAYHVEPTILEAQAYDATRLVVNNLTWRTNTAAKMQRQLQKVRKFHGVTGLMQFTSAGDVQKDLFVLTVHRGRIVEVGARGSNDKSSALPAQARERLVKQQPARPADVRQQTAAVAHEKYDIGGDADPVSLSPSTSKYGE